MVTMVTGLTVHTPPATRAGRWLALEDSNLGSRIQSPLSYH